jgi:hypothetical protein
MDNIEIIRNDEESEKMKTAVSLIEAEATELVVDSDEREMEGANLRLQIKEIQKKLKDRQEYFVRPSLDFVSIVRNLFAPTNEKIKRADEIIEGKCIAFHRAKEEKRAKEERELAKARDKAIKEGKVPEPVVTMQVAKTTRTENGMVSYKKYWTYDIENPDSVPREFCSPDPGKLSRAVKDGVRKIRGVRIYEETGTARRK